MPVFLLTPVSQKAWLRHFKFIPVVSISVLVSELSQQNIHMVFLERMAKENYAYMEKVHQHLEELLLSQKRRLA